MKASEIEKAIALRAKLAAEIRAQLAALGEGSDRAEEVRPFLLGSARAIDTKHSRQRVVTEEQQARWRAQGQYLSALRPLTKAQRSRVRAVRSAKGLRTALAAAAKMTRR